MLGSKRRFVILRDHGRLLPKPGLLAQMSQTAATGNSWERSRVSEYMGPAERATGRAYPMAVREERIVGRTPTSLSAAPRPGTGPRERRTPERDDDGHVGTQRRQRSRSQSVLRFVDVATDALGRGPRGDRRAQRLPGARRRHRHQPVPHRLRRPRRDPRGDGGDLDADLARRWPRSPRRAARRPRQLRGDPEPDAGRARRRIARATPEERNAVVVAEALREATDAQLRRGGGAGRGHHAHRGPGRRRRRARARPSRAGPRARDVFTAAAAAAREALARTPDQLQALRDAGVVDAGGRGLCVILDAAETVLTGRRPPPGPAGRPRPDDPGAGRPPTSSPPTARPTR